MGWVPAKSVASSPAKYGMNSSELGGRLSTAMVAAYASFLRAKVSRKLVENMVLSLGDEAPYHVRSPLYSIPFAWVFALLISVTHLSVGKAKADGIESPHRAAWDWPHPRHVGARGTGHSPLCPPTYPPPDEAQG